MIAILIEGPAVEPLTLAELRASLRLDDALEDALLADLLRAARVHVEDLTGRKLIAQTWRLIRDSWPRDGAIRSPLSPLIGIERIAIADAGGTFVDLPSETLRLLMEDPPRLLIARDAPTPGKTESGIRIDLVAGYGESAEAVPAPLVEAVRRIVARWFEHRGDDEVQGLPPDLAALIAPYRRLRV